jgi:hypothetical protein
MRTHGFDQADKSDSSKTALYGRQHARTAELYRKRREQRARAQEQAQPTNVMEPPKQEVVRPPEPDVWHLHPLQSARKLAGTVVAGALRVAHQVSARAKKAKGAGKKR